MLVNQGKNLARIDFPQLDALRQKLAEIDRLMVRAQAIDFRVDQLDDKFQSLFPQDFSSSLRTDSRVRYASSLLHSSLCAFRHTMTLLSSDHSSYLLSLFLFSYSFFFFFLF